MAWHPVKSELLSYNAWHDARPDLEGRLVLLLRHYLSHGLRHNLID